MNTFTEDRRQPLAAHAHRFISLLRAYPDVEARQVEQMIAIYPRLTILEMGLLSTDRILSEPLDAFMRDHGAQLGKSWRDQVVFAITIVSTLILLGWLVWTTA